MPSFLQLTELAAPSSGLPQLSLCLCCCALYRDALDFLSYSVELLEGRAPIPPSSAPRPQELAW